MGGGGSSCTPNMNAGNRAHPHCFNLHLAYMQCLKICDGEKINLRNILANNIIKNHDFSEGLQSWNPNRCKCVIVPSSEQGNNTHGRYVVLTDRKEWWSHLQQDITTGVTPGLAYTVSAVSGPLNGTSEILASLRLENHDSTYSYLNIARIHVAKHEWEILKATFVLESLPRRVFFYLEGPVPGLDLLIKSTVICPLISSIAQTHENVIANHQFDDGLKNWAGHGCNITLHDTLPKLHLTSDKVFAATRDRAQTWNGIEQEITGRVQRKLVYEATAVVRIYGNNVTSANVMATLLVQTLDNREQYVDIASVQATDGDWAQLQGKFLINGSPSNVVIYLEGPPPGTDILLKSLVVKLAEATPLLPPPPIEKASYGVNIIENSELSNGTDAWFPHGKCELSVRTGAPHVLPPLAKHSLGCHKPLSGRYILVTNRLQSWMGTKQIITGQVKLFLTYQVSVWVRIGSGSCGPQSVIVGLSVDNRWVDVGQVDATSDRWHEVRGSFRIEERPSKVTVLVQGPSSGVDLMVAGLRIFAVDRQARFEHLRREADKIRKRDVVLNFTGNSGEDSLGAFVNVKQTTNSFPLGSCINRTNLDNEDFVDFFVKNFNWAAFEDLSSHDDDEMIQLCQDNNIQLRGHCNFWEEEWTVQSWVSSLSHNDLINAVQNRLKHLLTGYKGKFKNFDMNNRILYRSGEELTRANMFKTAQEHDPDTVLFVNDYHIKEDMNPSTEKYIEQILELQEQGAPVGGIGIRGHMDSPVGGIMCSALDKFGVLGLPVWVTGLTVLSINEHVRAEDLEAVLREAFAHPAVEGVMLSGFWELFMSKHNSHLVNAEGGVNEAGKRLMKLRREWTSAASGHVDGRGEFGFRGFHGSYEVEVVTPAKRVTRRFVVDKDDSPLVLNIDV